MTDSGNFLEEASVHVKNKILRVHQRKEEAGILNKILEGHGQPCLGVHGLSWAGLRQIQANSTLEIYTARICPKHFLARVWWLSVLIWAFCYLIGQVSY